MRETAHPSAQTTLFRKNVRKEPGTGTHHRHHHHAKDRQTNAVIATKPQEERAIGNGEEDGKHQQGQDADQAVHEDRECRFRLLMMGAPCGRIGLPNIPSGGSQQEGVEEMGHERKPGHLAQRQLQTLDPKGFPPTKPPQKNQGTAEAKGQPQAPGIQTLGRLQKLRRAMGPRVLTLLPTPHGIPSLGLALGQKVDLRLVAKDSVEYGRQKQSTNCQANQLHQRSSRGVVGTGSHSNYSGPQTDRIWA